MNGIVIVLIIFFILCFYFVCSFYLLLWSCHNNTGAGCWEASSEHPHSGWSLLKAKEQEKCQHTVAFGNQGPPSPAAQPYWWGHTGQSQGHGPFLLLLLWATLAPGVQKRREDKPRVMLHSHGRSPDACENSDFNMQRNTTGLGHVFPAHEGKGRPQWLSGKSKGLSHPVGLGRQHF